MEEGEQLKEAAAAVFPGRKKKGESQQGIKRIRQHISNREMLPTALSSWRDKSRLSQTILAPRSVPALGWQASVPNPSSKKRHIVLKARPGFARSVYNQPFMPWDSSDSPLWQFISHLSRLQRPPPTSIHFILHLESFYATVWIHRKLVSAWQNMCLANQKLPHQCLNHGGKILLHC